MSMWFGCAACRLPKHGLMLISCIKQGTNDAKNRCILLRAIAKTINGRVVCVCVCAAQISVSFKHLARQLNKFNCE